jgi:hypothetical protein
LLSLFLLPPLAASGREPLVRAADDAAGGTARANAAGPWTPLGPSAPINYLGEVRSGDVPLRLVLRRGGAIVLAPHSSIAVLGGLDVPFGRGAGARDATSFELRSGEVDVDVPASAGAAVVVSSQEMFAALRPGSRARVRLGAVAADGGAPMAVALEAGDARVASTGAWQDLPARHEIEMRPRRRFGKPVPLPVAPEWRFETTPQDAGALAVVASEVATARLGARFARVPNADRYVAEVARDEAFTDVASSQVLSADDAGFVTAPLAPGRYFARVCAFGQLGFAGPPSSVRPMRIVRLSLPLGAREDRAGRWALPVGKSAFLGDAEGLEMAFGPGGFSRATRELRLDSEEPLRTKLRLQGDGFALPVVLEPRRLSARIEVTPRTAVWPRDPVTITVRVEENGAPAPTVTPSLRVALNLNDLPVRWEHDGAVWRARIEPRRSAGPWVVRVEALDAWGNELGRNFLEVAEEALEATAQR